MRAGRKPRNGSSERGRAREKSWQRAETIDKKLEGMLQFPLQTVERKTETTLSEDGKTIINHITEIKPARWSYRDVPNMALAIDRLRENSCRRNREMEAAQGGSAVVLREDIELIRRKRWIDAAPALLALMEKKRAALQGGQGEQDRSGEEPNAG